MINAGLIPGRGAQVEPLVRLHEIALQSFADEIQFSQIPLRGGVALIGCFLEPLAARSKSWGTPRPS